MVNEEVPGNRITKKVSGKLERKAVGLPQKVPDQVSFSKPGPNFFLGL